MITADSQLYQFFTFKGHRIAHIIPPRTSSFSEHGSADAVSAAINHVVSDGIILKESIIF